MNLTLFNFMAYRRVNNTHNKKDDFGRITIDIGLAASAIGKVRRGRLCVVLCQRLTNLRREPYLRLYGLEDGLYTQNIR